MMTVDFFLDILEGCVHQGRYDTVLVYPGEWVKILMQYKDFPGFYLYHYHKLEHEVIGMMRPIGWKNRSSETNQWPFVY